MNKMRFNLRIKFGVFGKKIFQATFSSLGPIGRVVFGPNQSVIKSLVGVFDEAIPKLQLDLEVFIASRSPKIFKVFLKANNLKMTGR